MKLRLFGRVPSSVTTGKQKLISPVGPKIYVTQCVTIAVSQRSVFTVLKYKTNSDKCQPFFRILSECSILEISDKRGYVVYRKEWEAEINAQLISTLHSPLLTLIYEQLY